MSIISTESQKRSTSANNEKTHHFQDDDQSPIIGYTEKELEIVRNSAFWKPVRYSLIVLFWLLWAGFLAGTTVIVVLNNGDVTTTIAPP